MAIEVFNRYENKYMLNKEAYESVKSSLFDYMELDSNNKYNETYTITNLYYDTDDNYLIRTSLQKPKYKEKLRLRAYGVPNADSRVYVEIKKKFSGLVNKRRSEMTLNEAYDFLRSGIMPDEKDYHNRQVLREIEYLLSNQKLSPALYLAYDRIAFFDTRRHDLRISFDTNIRTRRDDLSLEAGDYGEPLINGGAWLMEIKTAKSMPVWLCKMLSEYKIYPSSFSKYGTEYKKLLKQKQQYFNYSYARGNQPVDITKTVNA